MWWLRDADSQTLLCAWTAVTSVTLPLGAVLLRNVTRRIDARWEDKRRALGATKENRWRTMMTMKALPTRKNAGREVQRV